jgi:hypothetical protein
MRRPSKRSLAGGAAGIVAGVAAGIAMTSISAAGTPPDTPARTVDVAHLPPVLRLPGEPARLRFAIVCASRDDDGQCHGSGEVYARGGQAGPFRRYALSRGRDSSEGRYFVDLPAAIGSDAGGFSYYAVLRGDAGGTETVLPAGGAAAPQRSFPLPHPVEVDLGAHSFGQARAPEARPVDAKWGSGLGAVGLAGSRGLGFAGPSSFDVGSNGQVTVLDQVNGRVEHWLDGRVWATPVEVSDGLADLAVEPDGSLDVLEPPDRAVPVPVLRSFRRDGRPKWVTRLPDRTWVRLATGPSGPVVRQAPSEQWLPASEHGTALAPAAQAARGRPGRPFGDGHEVVVARVGVGELRVAELARDAVLHAWRITSATPLGEVQLAEPLNGRLVVVVKAYTDDRDEFLVVVLDHRSASRRFSVASAEWAEAAPLARFRVAGSALYRLGSTPGGAFVDRYDLEVQR